MIKASCPCTPITQAVKTPAHYFYGYYDKNPWNRAETRLLSHRTHFCDRFPSPQDRAEVGYVTLDAEPRFVALGETTAWNWQQGAQLQWLRRRGEKAERVIYNTRCNGSLAAVMLDPDSGERRQIDSPVYTLDPLGRYALSLNFARLYQTRMDYGIAGLVDLHAETPCPANDGIFRIDLETGDRALIVSIAQAAKAEPDSDSQGVKNWVNHMMFNPSGTRFCFLHRFLREDGIGHSRLLAADADGSNLRVLFEGMVSHYCWTDDTTILAWAGARKVLGNPRSRSGGIMTGARKILKPIYYALGKPRFLMQRIVRDSYYLIEDRAGGEARRFAFGQLTCDGHCSLSPDRRWVVTDGYTDGRNRLPLFLCPLHGERIVEIGRFATPKALDGPLRVDLHPRFNGDGTKICIDSAMDGTRQMYVLDVAKLIED